MINTLCVIGVGLIGGSLAKVLRKKKWCRRVIGIDTNQQALETALELNVIDDGFADVEQCTEVPDVVVIAVPVLRVKDVFAQLQPWKSQCKAVTDVCSTKMNVIQAYEDVFASSGENCFVPGHPIAGRETSGVAEAVNDLFLQKKVILTPLKSTSKDSINLVSDMWEQTGANVEQLGPQEHDKILAATSHLPHALAYSLVHCLSTQSHTEEIFRYAAGGFADFTRIASSDPVVWREICLANREQLLAALEHFDTSLLQLRDSLQANDGDALEKIFTQAKNARDEYRNS